MKRKFRLLRQLTKTRLSAWEAVSQSCSHCLAEGTWASCCLDDLLISCCAARADFGISRAAQDDGAEAEGRGGVDSRKGPRYLGGTFNLENSVSKEIAASLSIS